MTKKIFFLLFVTSFLLLKAQTTHTVASESEFNTALNSANRGDTIMWENGTYTDVFMDVDVDGITVKATTSGDVVFNGSSRVEIVGDDVKFLGFQFVGGNILVDGSTSTIPQTVITIDGNDVLVSNINISEYSCFKYLRIRDSSQRTEVSYCNFESRSNYADQNILQVDVNSGKSGFHNINHCSFKNFSGEPGSSGGDDGVEPIRIGSSSQASRSSKTVVEYCYFTSCNGDGEIISHKATECVYRYNTFDGNEISELVLRHGDKGIVYGNFFINGMGGVRIQEGSNHVVYNNYFSGLTSRSLNLNASSSDKLDNILIAYNTFVDSDYIDIESHSTDEATNITIANNIFSNPSSSSDGLFEDVTGDETWIGNIAFGNLGAASSSNFTIVNPELSLNAEGFYTISADSPVVNSGVTGYPSLPIFTDFTYDNEILLDVLGSNRPNTDAMKDVGSQEYTAGAVMKPHATEENTGPDYFREDGSLSTFNEELITKNFTVYPNPLVNDTINLKFNISEVSDVKVTILDSSGRKLLNLIDASYNTGNHNFTTSVDLNSGMYLLYIEISSGSIKASKVEKILKQ